MAKNTKILIGAHTSTAGGVHQALFEGKEIEATTIQFFTSNQKQWKGRVLTPEMIEKWQNALKETNLSHIMSHDSYLINLGGTNPEVLEKSCKAFHEEIERCKLLDVDYLNFHPGAALDGDIQECLDRIVENLLLTRPLLEKGRCGYYWKQLLARDHPLAIDLSISPTLLIKLKAKFRLVSVSIHAMFLLQDMMSEHQKLGEKTLDEFDKIIGLPFLYAFHLNDSLKELGSRVDRHQSLGEGKIGWECFRFLMTDSRTRHLPKYLETPEGKDVWKNEIQQLKNMAALC